jgi:hypothetical protein
MEAPTFEAGQFIGALGRVESQEFSQLGSVLLIFMDTELEVLAESFVELVEVVLVLGDLGEHVKNLLDQVLADDFEDLVLLKSFSGNVEGEIFRINDTFDKVEVFGDKIFTVIL